MARHVTRTIRYSISHNSATWYRLECELSDSARLLQYNSALQPARNTGESAGKHASFCEA